MTGLRQTASAPPFFKQGTMVMRLSAVTLWIALLSATSAWADDVPRFGMFETSFQQAGKHPIEVVGDSDGHSASCGRMNSAYGTVHTTLCATRCPQ